MNNVLTNVNTNVMISLEVATDNQIKIKRRLKIMYFKNVKNLEELKKAYKDLCKKHHPDKGGSTEIMQVINNEYQELFKTLKMNEEMAGEFTNIMSDLMSMDEVEIEIIGTWIWLSGNTYANKDKIKALGFKWSKKSSMWYHKPTAQGEEQEGNNYKRAYGIDIARANYGSETLKSSSKPKHLS